MGILQVQISITVPIPAYTIPATGMGTYLTMTPAVWPWCHTKPVVPKVPVGFALPYLSCNFVKVMHPSIDSALHFMR